MGHAERRALGDSARDGMPQNLRLFGLLCRRVNKRDVEEFVPSDPGYAGYVHTWTGILESGVVPRSCNFNLSEVICLTGYVAPKELAVVQRDRFLVYRLLMSSVALQLYVTGNDCEVVCPVNFVAIRLVNDARDLHDGEVLQGIGNVLRETAAILKTQSPVVEEYPFLHAADMIWSQRMGDYVRSDEAAKTLIAEEDLVRHSGDYFNFSSDFLFGLTNYDQLNEQWERAFSELGNPNNNEETQLVIDAVS